jgi:integrase
MASLRKNNRSNVWYAQYYVTDPTTGELAQVRKSTGETSKKKALARAAEMERAAKQTMQRDDDEQTQHVKAIHTQLGQEIARGTINGAALRKYFSSMMQVITGEEMNIPTIKSWCNEWLDRKTAAGSSKATMARYKGHSKAFLDWLGVDRSQKPLESVSTSDMERFKQALQARGIVGKTVLSYTKDIGAIYSGAVREGIISFNPMKAVAAPNTDDSHDRKPFTESEVQAMIDSAPNEEWRGMILAAAFTGLRLGDVARLQWSSINLEKKMITLMPAKTKRKKREVMIPIQPDLLAYLEQVTITDDEPCAFVFPELAKLGIGTREGLSQNFVKIMAAADVSRGKPSKEKAEGAGRITFERGFHSLRHTFTTWLRSAGVSEEDRMALTGHSTRDSHARYSHANEDNLRDAIGKLSSLKGKDHE